MHRAIAIFATVLIGALSGCRGPQLALSPPHSPYETASAHSSDRWQAEGPQDKVRLASAFAPQVEEAAADSMEGDGDGTGSADARSIDAPSVDAPSAETLSPGESNALSLDSPLTSPQTSPLTLAALEELALANHPTLSAASARMAAAEGTRQQAGRYPNPMIGYHATEIGNRSTAGQQGGFLSQRLITGGKLTLDQSMAGKEVEEAHFRFHAAEQRVLNDLRLRFYDTLVAQRRFELSRDLARIGDDLVAATEKLLSGRLGTENDLLQARIQADESQILVDNAAQGKAEAWRRMATAIGVPRMPMAPLDGNLQDDLSKWDWEQCRSMVLTHHPQLNAAITRVERAAIAIERAQVEPIPNVDVSVSHRHHNVTGDDVTNLQIGIPLPIFDKNRGNIRKAEAEWIAANNEVERIELALLDQLAIAFRRYCNAHKQVERYQQSILPNAKKSLELVTGGYQKGQVNYLSMLTAQQTYIRVQLTYLDSLRELRTAAALIQGQLLADSLKTP